MRPPFLLSLLALLSSPLISPASDSPALLAAKAFHASFPSCGKSITIPLDISTPALPTHPLETPENLPQTLINIAKRSFYNATKDPERFEMRKIQYDGGNYLKNLLEEEIYWLGTKPEWSIKQIAAFQILIKELTKLAESRENTAYVGRFNIEPEVNSYFYCELNHKEQTLKMEVFQRCD